MSSGSTVSQDGRSGARTRWLLPVRIAAVLLMFWAAAVDASWTGLLINGAFGLTLLALAWIDSRQLRLPDFLTLPLLAAGLTAGLLEGPEALLSGVIGALVGYIALRLIGEGYFRLRGQEGIGQGDAKLLAVGGAWLGWEALPWVVLLAAFLGLVFALLQRARGVPVTRETALPFGPPLALAIWIVRLHGFPEI